MKLVTIEPVEEPKSFEDVKFSQADWKNAVKVGPKTVPYVTAREAVRNSKGLYRMASMESVKEVVIKGLPDPEEMDSAALVQEMIVHGKRPRKKMSRKTAVEFVKKLRAEAAELIGDEDEE